MNRNNRSIHYNNNDYNYGHCNSNTSSIRHENCHKNKLIEIVTLVAIIMSVVSGVVVGIMTGMMVMMMTKEKKR